MAMLDTTIILPLLKRLQKSAKATGTNTSREVSEACAEFEREMIPRAFYWVNESGGCKAVVSTTIVIHDTKLTRNSLWIQTHSRGGLYQSP
jgi:hypothetical protein